jgi:uncharacterized Zn-binding protein involved in type VI secretion
MKDAKGRGVIRLGDRTTHGGKVISASTTLIVLGKGVACDGDSAFCPQCKGVFKIIVDGSDRKHHGKCVAYSDDRTSCGAVLISSI